MSLGLKNACPNALVWGALCLAIVLGPASSAVAEGPDLTFLRGQRTEALLRRDVLLREQASLEPALATVGQAIAARKALEPVTADASLEALLQRHREISERLTDISRELRAAASRVLRATQALIDGIDAHVTRLSRRTRGRSKAARAARASLRALLAERAQFAVGPVGGGCALPAVELSAADGPDEAKAKLNLLRDAEERCRRRIEKVETRLRRLRDERRLMQEAADFRDESEIFDEESRRRTQVRLEVPRTQASDPTPATPPPVGGGRATAGAPSAGVAGAGSPSGDFQDRASESSNAPSAVPTVVHRSQVDSTLGAARRETPDAEIGELTARRRELEQAARRIREALDSLTKRARALAPR
jgi:chromosome segregation ATPase